MSDAPDSLDLSECDEEPIHRIGSIRPSGCLLAVHRQSMTVSYCSANVQGLLQRKVEDVVGAPISACVPAALAQRLLPLIRGMRPLKVVNERFRWREDAHSKVTRVHLEPGGELVVMEVMLQDDPVSDVTDRLHATVDLRALSEMTDLGLLMDEVANRVRAFTEFDRVMVYRFEEDGSGCVTAEAVRPELESFLGLHYPATDIPKQARTLFIHNRVRVIEHVGHVPVDLVGHRGRAEDLDLSGALLRGISPIHLRYLANMGVHASLSISLIREGQLWGMIACHHYAPKALAPSMLAFTEMLSQMLSVMADRLDRAETNAQAVRCAQRVDRCMVRIGDHEDGVVAGIRDNLKDLADAVAADGILLLEGGSQSRWGEVPAEAGAEALRAWLDTRDGPLLVTDRLGELWPEGMEDHPDQPAGVIAFRWADDGWLVFCRRELVRSVFWAGDPNKPAERDADGRLSPRGSFEAWKDEVRGRARAFLAGEVDALRPLRRLAAMRELTRLGSDTGNGVLMPGVARDPVAIVDPDGIVQDWNFALEQHLGRSDIQGAHLTTMIPFDSEHGVSGVLQRALQGQLWVGEYQQANASGVFEVVVFPLPAQGVSADRIGVALRDLSEQRRLEEQLQRAEQMEALGQLSGSMVHNFNNLLTVIMNATDLALETLEPGHAALADLQAARKAGARAGELVREIMSFASRQVRSPSPVDLRAKVREVEVLLRNLLPPGIDLVMDMPEREAWVLCDWSQLEQVLLNLVSNARDAIGDKGRIRVGVRHHFLDRDAAAEVQLEEGPAVLLSVDDSGAGMTAEVLDRVFEPFFSTKLDSGGTGLGLSSAARAVREMGAGIRVRSRIGEGSSFAVVLPAWELAVDGAAPLDSGPEAAEPGGQRRVLVVDDDAAITGLLERFLVDRGYAVDTYTSARSALAELASGSRRVDVLLTDLSMPDMSGLALVEQARRLRGQLRVVVMSGRLPNELPAEHGVRWVQKPFQLQELAAMLDELSR